MNDRNRLNLLYDFYGGVLTKHSRTIYEMYIVEDYSVSEIAENLKISRQAVSFSIYKSTAKLEKYEGLLKLIDKFITIKDNTDSIKEELDSIKGKIGNIKYNSINNRLNRILEEI